MTSSLTRRAECRARFRSGPLVVSSTGNHFPRQRVITAVYSIPREPSPLREASYASVCATREDSHKQHDGDSESPRTCGVQHRRANRTCSEHLTCFHAAALSRTGISLNRANR